MIRNKKRILQIVSVLALVAVVWFVVFGKKSNELSRDRQGQAVFRAETFKGSSGWAYRIYQNAEPVIEQLTLPGIAGQQGFASEQQAASTAALVKKKLDQGIFPPTISPQELDSLGVDFPH